MIQKARNNNSRSFLREAEIAIMAISDEQARNYFLENLKKVFEKRKDPNVLLTGEKKLKTEILAYFTKKGIPKTANIWCRNLSIDRNDINMLLFKIQNALIEKNIEGVVELHLQDREINSPHIQFIGNRAEEAEVIIGKILVESGYETSIENAIGKKEDFEPYYNENKRAGTQKLEDELDFLENIKRRKKEKEERENDIDSILEKIDKELETSKDIINQIKNKKILYEKKINSLKEYKAEAKNKIDHLRKIRRKIKRRR